MNDLPVTILVEFAKLVLGLVALVVVMAALGGGLALLAWPFYKLWDWWWHRWHGLDEDSLRIKAEAGEADKRARLAWLLDIAQSDEPLATLRQLVRDRGGGGWIGVTANLQPVVSNPRHSLLVLGPPQRGKTRSIISPSVVVAPGPVVSTSIKTDVYDATADARRHLGRIWVFNPAPDRDEPVVPRGAKELRWSPVSTADDWDTAMLTAEAMAQAAMAGAGTSDAKHWGQRAADLLGPLLHAAAVSEPQRSINDVRRWVQRQATIVEAEELLDERGVELAQDGLHDIISCEDRERSSIFSTASTVLNAYKSAGALRAASSPEPGFSRRFVTSTDTLYITAPTQRQALVAPMFAGLLAELRYETYRANRAGRLRTHVTFALDELANIAPLHDIGELLSQAGGQGLHVIAGVQDLSVVRAKWNEHIARGFLSLFQTKVLLGGITDRDTLEIISMALGEHSVWRESQGTQTAWSGLGSESWGRSEHREARYSPGDIAGLDEGTGLFLTGVDELTVALTDHQDHEPWETLNSWLVRHPARLVYTANDPQNIRLHVLGQEESA